MGVCPAIRLDLGNHPSPAPKKTLSNISEKANTLLTAQSDESCTATADSTVVGSEYVLLVRKAGTTDLTPENLLYIDQQTAQTDSVTFDYTPRTAAGATVEIIGDFGSGIETRTAGEIEPPIVIVTVQVKTESGSTVTGAGEYYTGDTVTLTAQPRGKDRLDGWYVGGKCVGAGSTYTFTAEQDVTVRAVFTHPVIGGITVGDRTEKAKSAFTLSPNVQSNGTDYTLNFTSDNEKAATVDASGKVTTHKRGTATITVTATDEYGNTVSDACTVTVKYTFLQWLIIIFLFGWIWY